MPRRCETADFSKDSPTFIFRGNRFLLAQITLEHGSKVSFYHAGDQSPAQCHSAEGLTAQ